jgi:hypothetical protein
MKPMFRTTQVAVVFLAALLGAACTPAATQEVALTGKVKEVVDRSKTTRTTYAMYSWNELTLNSQPVQEWAAEFHSGDKHRVETPRDRLIADCKAQTGVALSLTTGKTVEGPMVAKAACGINTNKAFIAAEWQGVVQTPFGAADRVRLSDKSDIRTYDISPTGVILRSTYAQNTPEQPLNLSSEAVAVLPELPAPDMFDRASLARSYVPDRFRTAPGR